MISTPLQRKKLCDLILEIGKLEMKTEAVRQLLCEYQLFSPYSAFKRLDFSEINYISASDIKQFLLENSSTIPITQCELFVKLYDKDGNRSLNYEEFLDAVLPQDNPRLREKTLQKESITIFPGERMNHEVEFTLIKLIDWETKGVLELEQEKYDFLGKQSTNITKFLMACFYEIDLQRKGFFTNKELESFFLHNSKVIFPEETEAFFRRLSSGCYKDMMIENDFVIGLDFAPYNRNKESQQRIRMDAPIISQQQQQIQEMIENSSKQKLKTANFGERSEVLARSRIYSEDQYSQRKFQDNNSQLQQQTPTRTPVKNNLRSSSNYKTQPSSLLRSSSISNQSSRNNNDILSYSNTSFKNNNNPSPSVKFSTPNTQINANKARDFEKQQIMKKLALTKNNKSKVDQIATQNSASKTASAKKNTKFSVSNTDTIESFYQPSVANSANKNYNSLLNKTKTTPSKQRQQPISPNVNNQSFNKTPKNPSTIFIQNDNAYNNNNDHIKLNNNNENKQTLLEFKQEIRGQLATCKLQHERSISPVKQSSSQTRNTGYNSLQSTKLSFNNSATKRQPSKNTRNSSTHKLSQSYILIENDQSHKSPQKQQQSQKNSSSNNDLSMSQIMSLSKTKPTQQDGYKSMNNRSFLQTYKY